MSSLDVFNALLLLLVFVVYAGGLVLSVWRLGGLYVGYKLGIALTGSRHWPFLRIVHPSRTKPPRLLLYVLIFVALLLWPLVLIFGVRVLSQVLGIDTTQLLVGNTLWYAITSIPPAFGVVLFTWAVYHFVERHSPDAVEQQRRDDYDELHQDDELAS